MLSVSLGNSDFLCMFGKSLTICLGLGIDDTARQINASCDGRP